MTRKKHDKVVIDLAPDTINRGTTVTLCSCGDRRCTKWKKS